MLYTASKSLICAFDLIFMSMCLREIMQDLNDFEFYLILEHAVHMW